MKLMTPDYATQIPETHRPHYERLADLTRSRNIDVWAIGEMLTAAADDLGSIEYAGLCAAMDIGKRNAQRYRAAFRDLTQEECEGLSLRKTIDLLAYRRAQTVTGKASSESGWDSYSGQVSSSLYVYRLIWSVDGKDHVYVGSSKGFPSRLKLHFSRSSGSMTYVYFTVYGNPHRIEAEEIDDISQEGAEQRKVASDPTRVLINQYIAS